MKVLLAVLFIDIGGATGDLCRKGSALPWLISSGFCSSGPVFRKGSWGCSGYCFSCMIIISIVSIISIISIMILSQIISGGVQQTLDRPNWSRLTDPVEARLEARLEEAARFKEERPCKVQRTSVGGS